MLFSLFSDCLKSSTAWELTAFRFLSPNFERLLKTRKNVVVVFGMLTLNMMSFEKTDFVILIYVVSTIFFLCWFDLIEDYMIA